MCLLDTGGDRSSVGSSGSVTSLRSSGSGQSAGSAPHILHAQAEGVKVPHKLKTHLTTVLASLGVVLWCYLSLKVRSIQLKMYKCERVKREESKIMFYLLKNSYCLLFNTLTLELFELTKFQN